MQISHFSFLLLPWLGPRHFDSRDFFLRQAILQGRFDETLKEGMAIHGAGLKLGMELAAQEPRVVFKLDDLDQIAVGRESAQDHPLTAEEVPVAVVEFVAVAVALGNLLLA